MQPCLDVLAMGDAKAVLLAQEGTLGVLKADGVDTSRVVVYGCPVPRSSEPWLLVCIDDTCVQAEVTKEEAREQRPGADSELGSRVMAAFRKQGVEPKPSKVQWEKVDAVLLGTETLGEECRVAAPRRVVGQLMLLSAFVLGRPVLTRSAAESFLGSWDPGYCR